MPPAYAGGVIGSVAVAAPALEAGMSGSGFLTGLASGVRQIAAYAGRGVLAAGGTIGSIIVGALIPSNLGQDGCHGGDLIGCGFTSDGPEAVGTPGFPGNASSAGDGVYLNERIGDSEPTLIQENPHNLVPTQTKAEMSGSQIKRLTKNMQQNGYDQSKPVDAWRNPHTGRLEIQDGHHRTGAAKKAGLTEIPVQVWE